MKNCQLSAWGQTIRMSDNEWRIIIHSHLTNIELGSSLFGHTVNFGFTKLKAMGKDIVCRFRLIIIWDYILGKKLYQNWISTHWRNIFSCFAHYLHLNFSFRLHYSIFWLKSTIRQIRCASGWRLIVIIFAINILADCH